MYVTEKLVSMINTMLEIRYNGWTSFEEKCLQAFVVLESISWLGHFI